MEDVINPANLRTIASAGAQAYTALAQKRLLERQHKERMEMFREIRDLLTNLPQRLQRMVMGTPPSHQQHSNSEGVQFYTNAGYINVKHEYAAGNDGSVVFDILFETPWILPATVAYFLKFSREVTGFSVVLNFAAKFELKHGEDQQAPLVPRDVTISPRANNGKDWGVVNVKSHENGEEKITPVTLDTEIVEPPTGDGSTIRFKMKPQRLLNKIGAKIQFDSIMGPFEFQAETLTLGIDFDKLLRFQYQEKDWVETADGLLNFLQNNGIDIDLSEIQLPKEYRVKGILDWGGMGGMANIRTIASKIMPKFKAHEKFTVDNLMFTIATAVTNVNKIAKKLRDTLMAALPEGADAKAAREAADAKAAEEARAAREAREAAEEARAAEERRAKARTPKSAVVQAATTPPPPPPLNPYFAFLSQNEAIGSPDKTPQTSQTPRTPPPPPPPLARASPSTSQQTSHETSQQTSHETSQQTRNKSRLPKN